jgi:hypothetical protein
VVVYSSAETPKKTLLCGEMGRGVTLEDANKAETRNMKADAFGKSLR